MFLPRTISVAVDRIAREALGKDWALYAALLDHWAEIVGAEYARITTPVKITFPPRQKEARRLGGTLVIRLPKGLAMEFTFKIVQIQQRITGYFGYEAINKITLEPSFHSSVPDSAPVECEADPEALATIKETTKDIPGDELRAALEAFGTSVLKAAKRGD